MGIQTHTVIADPALGVAQESAEVRHHYTERDIASGNIDYGGNTTSGETVTHFSALGVGAVFQAMTLISTGVAKLPLNRYVAERSGRRIDQRNSVQQTVNKRFHASDESFGEYDYPIAPLSAYHGWQQLTADAVLWGNGYALISPTFELLPLMPNLTYYDSNIGFYATTIDGQLEWFAPSKIFHLKGPTVTPNTYGPRYPSLVARGLDLVYAAQEAIGNALALQGFQSKFIKNGMRSGGILQLPAGMTKDARDKVESGFKKLMSDSGSWFKTIILRENAQYQQTTMDAAVQEQGTATDNQVRELARFFNLQPSDLGIEDANGYGSRQEDSRRFLERTLQPWLEAIVAECWLKLTTDTERRMGRVEFEHDVSALLRMSPLEQAQADREDIMSGVQSRQDVRDRRKMPRVPGLEKYLYMSNMLVVGEEETGTDSDPPPPDERTVRIRRVVFEITRMARHKAVDPSKFITWIDGDLTFNRREYRSLLQEPADEFIDPIVTRLQQIARSASAEHLPAAVNAYAEELESGI